MISERPQRPSMLSAFGSGAMSGLFSGIVMSLIIATVVPALPLFGLAAAAEATFTGTLLSSGPIMVLASTLFGGVMSAKRALFDAPNHSSKYINSEVPVPISGISGPSVAPVITAPIITYADQAPEQPAPTKNWVAETGHSEDSRSRIQQILADGSLSDKDRASAILASREAAEHQASRS